MTVVDHVHEVFLTRHPEGELWRSSTVPARWWVRNGTAGVLSRCHHAGMRQKNAKNELGDATCASVRREMAKPRMARSARIAELNLDAVRTPEQPSATVAGTVSKIIASPGPSQTVQVFLRVWSQRATGR